MSVVTADRIDTPPGWPEEVRPPGAPKWEETAVSVLLDCCLPDYRAYPVLRRHALVAAQFTAEYMDQQMGSCEAGLGRVRAQLADVTYPSVVQEAVDAWQAEAARLRRTRRAVALVEEALRGRVFIRPL